MLSTGLQAREFSHALPVRAVDGRIHGQRERDRERERGRETDRQRHGGRGRGGLTAADSQ